mmetsp:Transcript_5758/g.13115  ORF Transcript_5758/g.13115 Transcript_5758/m.13115 type:complete len:414 (+) Transcript_5758:88-1329(+)
MAHVIMTRRLLGVGLRRPAPSSTSCLMYPLENLSLQSHITTPAPAIQLPYNHAFSSLSLKKNDPNSPIVELPPNLKIDPRAKSSPFYGATIVEPEKKKKKKPKKETDNQLESTSAAIDSKESSDDEKANESAEASLEGEEDMDEYEDYDSEDEDEEEQILYDLSTKPEIARAVPLPQRLHVPVIDIKTGEEVGTFHLSEKTFGNDPVRVDILQRVVVWQRNKKRGKRNAGAITKTVSEVSGSGRKVRPQKGGGQARAGHSRPAHWRGGAKAHGPKGRVQDYTTKLNKKVRKMGVRHALSQKLLEGNMVITSDMAVPTHKTRALDVMLNRFGISGKKGVNALIIDDADPADAENEASVYGGLDVNFKVAMGNLHQVKMLNQLGCNVYDLLKFKKVVLSLAAVRSLEERLERDLK